MSWGKSYCEFMTRGIIISLGCISDTDFRTCQNAVFSILFYNEKNVPKWWFQYVAEFTVKMSSSVLAMVLLKCQDVSNNEIECVKYQKNISCLSGVLVTQGAKRNSK